MQILTTKVQKNTYTKVKPSVSKSLTSVINHLTQAIKKQCNNKIAHPHLLQNLTFANINNKYEYMINILPNPQPILPHNKSISQDKYSSTCNNALSVQPEITA